MTKKQAIQEAIDCTGYIGSHRPSAIEEELNKRGYRIVAMKRAKTDKRK